MEKKSIKEEFLKDLPIFLKMGKWYWIVLIGTVLGTILEGLLPHSFGTFIANFKSGLNSTFLLNKYDKSFTEASQFGLNWLPALSSALPCLLLPLFSLCINGLKRFYQAVSIIAFLFAGFSCVISSLVSQWEILFLTYSFIYSISTSLFLAVVIAIITDYFPVEHQCHVLATSLYQIGYPIASLIGNPVSASLIVQYGWRNTLRVLAIVQVCFGILVGFSMKPKDQGICCNKNISEEMPIFLDEEETENDKANNEPTKSKDSLMKILGKYQFWPWMIAKYINYTCWYGLRTNIVTYIIKSTSFGLESSASLMSAYAAAEIVVAILASIFGDKFRGALIHIHLIAAASMAVLAGIYSVALTSYLSGIILMMSIGAAVQLSLSFGFPASVEVLNSDFDMKTGWILTNVAAGLGILSSPILSGLLMDYFSLKVLFYGQSVGWTLQAIFYCLTIFIMKAKNKDISADYNEFNSGK